MKDIEMYEVDTELRRVDRRTIQMGNTECETVYKENGDMWHSVDNISPTKLVNPQFGECPDTFKAYWMSMSGATVLLISARCECV